MRNRARLSFVGLVLVGVIAALGPAVSANGGVIGTTPTEVCNPTGRTICLTVQTFEGITASDSSRSDGDRYTYVQWKIRNNGGTTLTHPTVTVKLNPDLCGPTFTNLSFCNDPPGPAPPPPSTGELKLPAVTVANDGTETVTNICSLDGTTIVCVYPNLAGFAGTSQFTRVYFKTADLPAKASDITVEAKVKERANDENPCGVSDPNCDTLPVTIRNSYEPLDDEAFTFALSGNRFNLPTNDLLASITFTATSPINKLTTFKKLDALTDPPSNYCFSDVACYGRVLFADTGGVQTFGSGNPVVFYARITSPPVPQNKIWAIHIYDETGFTRVSSSRIKATTSTLDFSRMDGVEFKSAQFGQPAAKYFIVPGSYDPGDKSFQLSATKGGAVITSLTGTDGTGNPIRIIGDQNDEKSTTLCTTDAQTSLSGPMICVKKVTGQVFDTYVWDLGNGWVVH